MLWFRRDLRLADHPALCAATAGGPVTPLFVLDPVFLTRAGAPRLAFLLAGLAALDDSMGASLVVRAGDPATVVPELAEEIGASCTDAVRAFTAVTSIFDLRELWRQIDELDGRVPSSTADELVLETRRLLDRASRWMLSNRPQPLTISAAISRFRPVVAEKKKKVLST